MNARTDIWELMIFSDIPEDKILEYKAQGSIPLKDRSKYYKGICHKKCIPVKLVNYYNPDITDKEKKDYIIATSFWNLEEDYCDKLIQKWIKMEFIPKGSALLKSKMYPITDMELRDEQWIFKV